MRERLEGSAASPFQAGPEFTVAQHIIADRWANDMRTRGLSTEIDWRAESGSETLRIASRWMDVPRWRVWRCGEEAVAWNADGGRVLVASSLMIALAAITEALDRDDAPA